MTEDLNPLALAADALEQACELVDQAAELDETLQHYFKDAQLALSEEIDKRIAFDRWLKIQVQAAQEAVMFYEQRIADLATVHNRFKERTQAVIESKPDLPYRGKLGKIWVQKNNPGVEYAFGSKDVTPDLVNMFGVPDDYVKSKIVYWIDSERLKAELLGGKEFPWASLRQSKSVRFPAQRTKKDDSKA